MYECTTRRCALFIVTTIVSILLAATMASSFVRKVTGDSASEQLRERLRLPPGLWRVVGMLELAAAAGLIVGLVLAPLGAAAAVGIALIMAGAMVLHLRVHIAGIALLAPLVVLAFATATAALRITTA